MKLAFLYAGQGSQRVGMGHDFYEEYPLFRKTFDSADPGFDLKKTCFMGPADTLSRTRYTQPCMLAFAAGVTALLFDAGITPAMAAGLSLGEYAALHAAGALDYPTALALIAFRGRVMEEAVVDRPSAMAAVIQFDTGAMEKICHDVAGIGVCEIANYNCPGQFVIGGDRAAVTAAAELAESQGARRCVPLNVSGPFHTSLMAPAAEALRERFRDISFGDMRFPVLFNCLGDFMREGDTIPDLLARQVCSSVYMEDIIRRMEACDVDAVVEIGPGKTLSGFVRKTARGMRVFPIDSAADFAALLPVLKEACIA